MHVLKVVCATCVFICASTIHAQVSGDATTQNQILSFPLGAATDPQNPLEPSKDPATPSGDPYLAAINSVFDHSMGTDLGKFRLYGCDQLVKSFSLEEGANTPPSTFGAFCVNGGLAAGFGQAGGGQFFVNGTYAGAREPTALFYDGHPGIDFVAHFVPVKAAAKGTIYYPKFMRGITDGEAFSRYHVLALIPDGHPDIRLYYLHLATHPSGEKCPTKKPSFADKCPPGVILPIPVKDSPVGVEDGQIIGISGEAGVQGSPHLHFEVQRILPLAMVDPAIASFVTCKEDPTIPNFANMACLPVDPYGWDKELIGCTQKSDGYSCQASAISDPYTLVTGALKSSVENIRLWNNQVTIDSLTSTADLASDTIRFQVVGRNIDSDTHICFWQMANPTPIRTCPTRTDTVAVPGQLSYDGHLEPGDYFLYLESGDGRHRSNARKLHIEKRIIFPPIAAFTMSFSAVSAHEGEALSVLIPIGKTIPVTFDGGASVANGSSIAGWSWTIDGINVSTAESFTVPIGLGTHQVSLTVTNALGMISLPANGTINANPANLLPSVMFDGSTDALNRFFFASFQTPIIDSQNRLLVVSTHFGFSCPFNQCGLRANAISPQGTLIWQSPSDGTFITHSSGGAPALGRNDVLFVPGFDTGIFAIDSSGTPVSGWPLFVLASGGNSALSGMIVDNDSGILYAKAGQSFSFDSFSNRTVAVKQSDASPIWEKVYQDGGAQVTIVKGPNNAIDSINVDRLAQTTFVSLVNGNEVCSSPTVAAFNSFVGGQEGVFSSAFGTINAYDSNCGVSNIFTAPIGFVNLRAFDQGKMFGFDNEPGFTGLFAIATDGTPLWRDANVFAPAIQAIRNGVIYAWAIDTSDSDKMKLFLIDELSGTILQSMGTSAFCNDCGFAVANDGTIYMADHNSTKIYKLN